MPKRAHGAAFPPSAPNRILFSTHSVGHPPPHPSRLTLMRAQMQSPCLPSSISTPHVPGQWPLEDGSTTNCDESRVSHSSTFTTVGKWVAIVADISTLFSLPHDFARKFLRRQKINIVSILGENGSSKKRLLDAGFANEPKKRSPSPQAHAYTTQRASPQSSQALSLKIWYQSRNHGQSNGFQVTQTAIENPNVDDDLDFSFSDILTSIPFQNPLPRSPVRSPLHKLYIASPQSQNSTGSHVRKADCSGEGLNISPSRFPSMSHRPPHTILRRRLLKLQLRTPSEPETIKEQSFPESDISPTTYTKLEAHLSNMPAASPSSLQTSTSSSSLRTNVEHSLSESHDSPTPPPESAPSPSTSYENDLSFVSDGPSTPPGKVRRAHDTGARSFYFDEKAGQMLDSALQNITSKPVKGIPSEYKKHDHIPKEYKQNISFPSLRTEENLSDSEGSELEGKDGSRGVPEDTFDDSDNSIDELQLSDELLQTLQEDLNEKLALAPPPPLPIKPLIASLSAEEVKMLETVAKETDHGKNATFDIVPEKLNARDFGTLLPNQFNGDPKAWLNDNIVNEYLAILVAHKKKEAGFEHKRGGPAPPVHAFSSFWYSTAASRPKSVERWATRFQLGGRQYLDAELVLYPICDGGHWRLLVVVPKQRKIEYFDSLGFSGDKYVKTFKDYIKKELGEAWIEDEWTVVEQQRSSRQLNGSDCGVFTLLNALVALREEEAQRVVACCGMPDARERIAITLMARQPTTEWD